MVSYYSGFNWLSPVVRGQDFYTISKRLSQFMRRDFSCIHSDIIPDLFPASYDRRLARDVPLVESIAKEHATWYRRKPSRSWAMPSGDPLSPNQVRALDRLYSSLKVDQHMKRLNEMLVVQGTVCGVVVPQQGTSGLYQILLFEPWEMEVDPSPTMSEDVQAWAREGEFRFRIPIAATHGRASFGTMRISADKAVYDVNGKTVGIYREDGSLPPEFNGQVPIFVGRLGIPQKGDFFAPLKTDIYDAQVSTSVGFSDLDHAARFGAWGQKVVTNATRAEMETMVLGPDRVLSLDDDQKMEVVKGGGNLAEYQQAQESFLRFVSLHNNLNPQTFVKGSLTGLSKMLDLHDRDSIRQDQVIALRDVENQLYQALRLVLNAGIRSESWPRADVTVDFKEIPMPENRLQLQQAQRMTFEDGLSSPSRELAREANISQEEARRQVDENLAEYRQIRQAMTADPSEVVEVEEDAL